EPRQIGRLLDPHIHCPGDVSNFFRDGSGDLLVAHQIPSDQLDVVRSGQAKVNGLAHDIGREEIERYAREVTIEDEPQVSNVVSGRAMTCLQGNHNISVGRSGCAAVVVAQVNARNGNPDVIYDPLEFLSGNFTANA